MLFYRRLESFFVFGDLVGVRCVLLGSRIEFAHGECVAVPVLQP